MTLAEDLNSTSAQPPRQGLRWLGLIIVFGLAAAGFYFWHDHVLEERPLGPQHQALKLASQRAGATDLKVNPLSDGGLLIDGRLAGRQFALRIPSSWNHQGVVFAHGYSTPGTSIAIPKDPFTADGIGMFAYLYGRGFAVGESAFDKSGIGVESGVYNTLRLKEFIDRLGATRVYLTGGSMGGNITMALIEQHPHVFAGALSACGVVDGWPSEIGYLVDLRASYNYFTEDTPYALPGNHDLATSALSALPPRHLPFLTPIYQLVQIKRISSPILALFADAKAHPDGLEAHLIDKIAASSGSPAEVASFLFPLLTIGLGMDDINETYGGLVYGNDKRVYRIPSFSDQENAALNRSVQRIHADPQAVANAAVWHQSTGTFVTPLVTLHNQVDSLVPNAQEEALRASVDRSANMAHLLQRTVPPLTMTIPTTSVKGIAHCGFTPQQVSSAWQDLQNWVESGQKPQ